MTKTFDLSYIPYCTKDLHHYLKPLSTTDELLHLRQYFYYQKNLAIRLIKYQRLLTSTYNRHGIRFNNKLYVDKKLFEKFGLSPIYSNPQVLIINENKFNRTLNLIDIHQNNPNKQRQISSPLKSNKSITTIESCIKNIDTPIIKLDTCSTLIATGYGLAKVVCLSTSTDTEQQFNHGIIDEDISLSKTCKRISNRSLFRRKINRKPSNIHSFMLPNKISQNQF